MNFEWDKNKEKANIEKHGINFELSKILFMSKMVIEEDDRKPYGEKRYKGFGFIDGRCMSVAFTVRDKTTRIISLRKANRRESRRYQETISHN